MEYDYTSALNISWVNNLFLTETFHDSPQSLHKNASIIPGIGHDVSVPNPFPFITHLKIDVSEL
jgi:hypothetical protein